MASASSSTTRQRSTLRDVTNEVTKEKLAWLENQRKVLKSHYANILVKYEQPENKASLTFLKEIHDTLEKCPDGDNPDPDTTKDLKVLLNWINTEDADAAIYFGTRQLIQDWIDRLVTSIKNQIEKCEYSCMYANAMTQYMDSNGDSIPEIEEEAAGAGDGKAKASASNKRDTIAEFEKRVFSAAAPDGFSKELFEELLNNKLFDMEDPAERKQLHELRERVEQYCKHFSETQEVTTRDLKLCIAGLLQEDLLGRDKSATLKELKQNDDALTEVCTLLNKRVKNYSTWSWPAPVVVDFKRNIAGRYRAYMDEDILTAILLHFVGAKWSIFLKFCFKRIYTSKMWRRGTGTVGDLYYQQDSIEGFRRQFHEQSFLTVLPSIMTDVACSLAIYDDERKVRPTSRGNDNEQTPMQIKQRLLHLISNEIHLNNALRPEAPLAIVQTDMEWFGPSLIHEVVLSLMKNIGVSEGWLKFFKNFLEAPLKIGSPSAPVQIRKRGAPISHQLTTLFGESLLFIMDLFVNRESGLSIYRIHDDFWFWSHDTQKVIKAWTAMQTFTKLAGLHLNEEKSASILCKSEYKDDPTAILFGPEPLPQKHVKWGFVVLYSDGYFRISDELLGPHVKEMGDYLEKADSAMNWIHGHNRYIRFFIRNFAEPALTFQRQHIVQIMAKLKDILKQVHPSTNGDAVEALKLRFPELFKGKDVMDSWVHWPVESGGLSLFNPFLDLIPLHEAYRLREERDEKYEQVSSHFASVIVEDRKAWLQLVEKSKERRKKRSQHTPHSQEELEEDTISDDEAYAKAHENYKTGQNIAKRDKRVKFEARCQRYRETKWGHWRAQYCNLLENLNPISSAGSNSWRESLYTDQIEGKLGHGESEFVDDNLVPLSLITAMQAERVHKN